MPNPSTKQTMLHGVFIDALGIGVLLTGVSGIGKSELALGLINRNHRLVADDSVIFTCADNKKIIGHCPPALQDFLEVRGLGILNIRAMFGDTAIKEQKQLQLVVHIISISNEELHNIDRLHGLHRHFEVLGVQVPEVSIPVAPGRSLAVLIEGAVRNHVLKMTGYHASKEFENRHQQLLEEDAKVGANDA